MARQSSALEFKSASLHALRAVLHSADTASLIEALAEQMARAGDFYANEPVVLDAQELSEAPDWRALCAALRGYKLYPIGLQASAALQAGAGELAALDLAPSARAASASEANAQPAPGAKSAASGASGAASTDAPIGGAAQTTMVIRQPLRSGQRVYAQGRDLLVLGMVSQGAEVIADGHIHVYGPLRGKAIAGAAGRTDALILTTHLDAELLAIAGVYRVIETTLPEPLQRAAAVISLDGETLRMRPLAESH